ncbi:MAG: hypothetical protein L3J14_01375 [Flavobacteriaceae bacterium]|nr:hypothetical protein [Flavobacteriaceae bacterium]
MSKLSTSFQFISEITDNQLYIKLIKQLNKDFQMTGIEEGFLLEITPKSLISQLQNTIYKLISNNYSEYLNLMYRIDVSEGRLKQIESSDVEQIVYLILKREWQKVWIRSKF